MMIKLSIWVHFSQLQRLHSPIDYAKFIHYCKLHFNERPLSVVAIDHEIFNHSSRYL